MRPSTIGSYAFPLDALPNKEAGKVADAGKATGKGGKNTTVKGRKKGPCDHLRQGNGTGPYRGGAHSKTSKPSNDGKDSGTAHPM